MWSLKKSHVKYQVVGDGIGMHDDMGVKFFENFGHRKIYWEISCTFSGTSIGMPVYPGNFPHGIWLLREFLGNAGSIIPKLLWTVLGHVLVSSS